MSWAWPTLPECITTKRLVEALSLAHALSRGWGLTPPRRSSSGSPRSALVGALLREPRAHRLADRDDAVGPAQIGADDAAAPRRDGFSSRPSRSAISGNTSWLITSNGAPEAPGDDDPDVTDDRRVGHAEDEVGPLAIAAR